MRSLTALQGVSTLRRPSCPERKREGEIKKERERDKERERERERGGLFYMRFAPFRETSWGHAPVLPWPRSKGTRAAPMSNTRPCWATTTATPPHSPGGAEYYTSVAATTPILLGQDRRKPLQDCAVMGVTKTSFHDLLKSSFHSSEKHYLCGKSWLKMPAT